MRIMFAVDLIFNDDKSKWDVSRVSNIQGMFTRASTFNDDISKWDVSSVTDMPDMFAGASTLMTTSQSGTCSA